MYSTLHCLLYYGMVTDVWEQFAYSGGVLFVSYVINYVPFLFTERTTFLYQYLPALLFQLLLLAAVFEHLGHLVAVRYEGLTFL